MEKLLHEGKGYTILVYDHTVAMTPAPVYIAQGLFDTAEDAYAYVAGGARIKFSNGAYNLIEHYIVIPLVMQG
jgi:hypothetical protein